jgi:DNA modification methylase
MKLSSIHINPDNPRTIKDERFKKLVRSITDFPKMMELRPIVVDNKGMILGGNMRFKALKELGYKDVPNEWVKRAEELTEAEKEEFIAKDNVPFGEWDWETLANEWDQEKLAEWGLEIPDFAFNKPEAVEDDYEIPDEIKTDIVLGDLFEIGEHRLLCGDSTDSDSVAKLMNGRKADLGLCDPPYNLNFKYNSYKDDKTKKEYLDWCSEWFSVLKLNTINQIITCGKQNTFMWGNIEVPVDYGIWYAKNKMSGGKISNLALIEPVLFYGKINRNSRANDFYDYNVKQQKETGNHACPKILTFFADLIKCYSIQTVLDLFLGSGTTMVASHQLNRKCYGMEIDPKYCQVIIDRMKKLDPEIVIKKNGVPIDKS